MFGLMSHCTTNMFFAYQLMLLQEIVIHKKEILETQV